MNIRSIPCLPPLTEMAERLFDRLRVSLSVICLTILSLGCLPSHAQQPSVEPLLEVPLHRIPKDVTYEVYQDANRRVGLAVFYGLVPGGVHAYANEPTKGWVLSGTAIAGLIAMISGLTMTEETVQKNDRYETIDIGSRTFYRVPVEVSGDNTTFRLDEVSQKERTLTTGGGALLGLGITALVGTYIYDFYHGIKLIESKRDKARYKIGQAISGQARRRGGQDFGALVKVTPMIDPRGSSAGLKLQMDF
jgi:hypothetical protein